MQKLFENKLWVIVIAFLALIALAGLASGLENVPFHNAQPLTFNNTRGGGLDAGEMLDTWREIPFWMQAGVWLSIFFLVILIGALLSPENRKLLLRTIFRAAVTYWVLYFLFTKYGDELNLTLTNILSPAGGQSAAGNNTTPPPVFTPAASLIWVSYAISVFILLAAIFITWRTYKFWISLREGNDSPIKDLADIARASIRDLNAGRDSTDVILNCYYRMSDAVADKRDMQRKASMTASEFAVKLEQAGLPGDAVRRLTRLFESVRYGGKHSSPNDVNEAVACLNIILQYCGESA